MVDVGSTFPDLLDADEDGIPDYLQSLIDDNVTDAQIQEYSDQILEEIGADTDGDGIPDADDTMDETDDSGDFMEALDAINEAVDEISENIDELVQGLSCGF